MGTLWTELLGQMGNGSPVDGVVGSGGKWTPCGRSCWVRWEMDTLWTELLGQVGNGHPVDGIVGSGGKWTPCGWSCWISWDWLGIDYMDTTDFCSSNRKMHNFSLAINEVIHIHGIHAASRVPSFPPKACSQGYHGKVARYFVIEITKFEIRNCDVTLTILSGLLQKYSLLRVYNCRNYTNEVLHVYADSFIFLLGKKYTRTSEYYFDIKLSTLDPGSSINGATASRHVAAYSSFQFCLKVSFLLTFLNSHMSPPR
ncbi:uncharacterized protein LOC106157932 isoform X1 [Lingula anatina]|uniref:Uncharacterized protein LOC106157932 isoform X1 n=1 Tax=Lingula anatina TaxID=7574 RepID=A0A1S3HT22_LINAN|nr:uncharacterized protein LOC106157932 isoform X1 [Lingula anatina]|eukprot:XP_013389187.1 uncharacterized protein LOC106157932 isoform X1 [Lingula anatina]